MTAKLNFNLSIAFYIISAIFIFSCSKDLGRNNAKESIIKSYGLPKIESREISKIYVKSYHRSGWKACMVLGEKYADVKNMLDDLEAKGVIKVTENGPIGECNIIQAVVSLTGEGRKYLVSETKEKIRVKTNDVAFGEITGIQMINELNIASVDFTLVRKNISPFGTGLSTQPMNRSTNFSLYDDGWRILD